jgi:hypothetical protein
VSVRKCGAWQGQLTTDYSDCRIEKHGVSVPVGGRARIWTATARAAALPLRAGGQNPQVARSRGRQCLFPLWRASAASGWDNAMKHWQLAFEVQSLRTFDRLHLHGALPTSSLRSPSRAGTCSKHYPQMTGTLCWALERRCHRGQSERRAPGWSIAALRASRALISY